MGNIDNMQKQIGFHDFFQSGVKGFDQRGWQFLNETNRIREQSLISAGQFNTARCGSSVANN